MPKINQQDKDKLQAFLDEYKQLVLKHQVMIGSCGCCDSPFVELIAKVQEEIDKHFEHLQMDITS